MVSNKLRYLGILNFKIQVKKLIFTSLGLGYLQGIKSTFHET